VIYRDRTAAEIRDIVVRRHVNGAWLEPLGLGAENWFIEGCPVNGPAIAANGEDVAAAWFTAAGDEPRVRFARSSDGGTSFGSPVDIDAAGSYGQVDLVLRDDGVAALSWWRRAEAGGIDLALRTVSPDGALGSVELVAHNDVSQPIDVPQMIAVDDGLLLAWSTFADDGAVKTAYIEGLR